MPAGVRNPRLGRLRRHPVLSLTAALLLLAGAVFGGIWGYGVLFPPALSCGPGMTAAGTPLACVGVNLGSTPFTKGEPERMRKLQDRIRTANDAVQGNSTSVVLMLNLSPVEDVDTLTYESLYHNVEGAIAAVWRANNTAAYGSTPGVKLYLANMGSQYGSWQQAVASVKKNAAAEHISAVVGLGQSTEQTRQAAAAISAQLHIPVIGSTVTGNSMNLDPADPAGKRTIPDMFRVSPTNSDSVIAVNQYVSGLRPAVSSLAVVADSVADDDYTATLAAEAKTRFQAPDRTVTVLPYTSPRSLPSGAGRRDYLIQQFNLMHANLCQAAPSVVYFAGRGRDLGAFVQNWVQGTPCGIPQLRILVGDDASEAIRDDAVLKGVASGRVTVAYTALASPDEWGTECPGSDAKRNYDQFWSAFTGRPDPCTKQPWPPPRPPRRPGLRPGGPRQRTGDAHARRRRRRDQRGPARRGGPEEPGAGDRHPPPVLLRADAPGGERLAVLRRRRQPGRQARPHRPAQRGRDDEDGHPHLAELRPQPEPAPARRYGSPGLLTKPATADRSTDRRCQWTGPSLRQ